MVDGAVRCLLGHMMDSLEQEPLVLVLRAPRAAACGPSVRFRISLAKARHPNADVIWLSNVLDCLHLDVVDLDFNNADLDRCSYDTTCDATPHVMCAWCDVSSDDGASWRTVAGLDETSLRTPDGFDRSAVASRARRGTLDDISGIRDMNRAFEVDIIEAATRFVGAHLVGRCADTLVVDLDDEMDDDCFVDSVLECKCCARRVRDCRRRICK